MTTPISNLTATWSNASVTYNAISMNVNTAAYAVGSMLFNLKVNGTSVMSVDPTGVIYAKTMNLVNSIGITQIITTTYTTPGAYTHNANTRMVYAEVKATGGGGASGAADGSDGDAGDYVSVAAGGGGGGGTSISYMNATDFGTNAIIVVGQGGTANTTRPRVALEVGVIAGNSGGGTTVTFNGPHAIMRANGGNGALGVSLSFSARGSTYGLGGTGGSAGGGDINLSGGDGEHGFAAAKAAEAPFAARGGMGGSSYWSGPIRGNNAVTDSTTLSSNADPVPATAYGAGAGGGGTANSGVSFNAAGANGIVVITEYLS